jgi:phosphatidylinositol-4,5-bisphosphate 3-kinase
VYTLNMNTNQIKIETNVDEEYRRRANLAIDSIEGLLKLKIGNWLTVSK